MAAQAFFRYDGEYYHPTAASTGPWRPNSLLGRAVTGVLGHEINRLHGAPGFIPARLTVELHSLPDLSPISIETRVARDGGRIKLIEAQLISNDKPMASATCQLLKHTQPPEGTVWKPQDWNVPAPETLEVPEKYRRWIWDMRLIEGDAGRVGPKKIWMREFRELVEGVPITPFDRIALAMDYISPISHSGDKGARYINTDATLYLHRLPEQDWIGVDVWDHQATDGIAVGHCRLYDQLGPIGFGSAAALAQRPAPRTGKE